MVETYSKQAVVAQNQKVSWVLSLKIVCFILIFIRCPMMYQANYYVAYYIMRNINIIANIWLNFYKI